MKKTIKEELKEQYIKAQLITDNALLIYTENENDKNLIDIKLRYISGRTIREQFLTTISKKTYTAYSNILSINESNDAIAIYKLEDDSLKLDRLYYLEEHTFAVDDFLDIEYKKMFPNRQLVFKPLKRGEKNGKY